MLDCTCPFSPKCSMFSTWFCPNTGGYQNLWRWRKGPSEPWDCWGYEQFVLVMCLFRACFVLVQSISFLFCQVCWLDSKTFFPAYFTYHLTKSAGEISPKSAATPKRLQVSPHAALAWLAPAPPRRCGGVSSRRVRGNWWNGASLVGMIYLQLGATLYNWVIIIYQ